MLFDEDFMADIIEHSPLPRARHAAVAAGGPEDEDGERDDDGVAGPDRGTDRGDSSVTGDRGNRTGDRDSPGAPAHHGDDQHHGNR